MYTWHFHLELTCVSGTFRGRPFNLWVSRNITTCARCALLDQLFKLLIALKAFFLFEPWVLLVKAAFVVKNDKSTHELSIGEVI